jgi:hypothetical protein
MAEHHKIKEPIAEMWYLRPVLNPTMMESDSSESPAQAPGLKSSALEADSNSEDSLSQEAMQPARKRMATADIRDTLLPVQKNPKKTRHNAQYALPVAMHSHVKGSTLHC